MKSKNEERKFLILGSSIAMGVCVPALWVYKYLKNKGNVICEFKVLEEMYPEHYKANLEKNKSKFHNDFKIAKIAHKFPNKVNQVLDDQMIKAFLEECIRKQYDSIIVFSGFWDEIIVKLINLDSKFKSKLFAVHMDTVFSNSWKNKDMSKYEELWLFKKDTNQIMYKLAEFERERKEEIYHRIVAHGGGWGMGTYREYKGILNKFGFKVNEVIYYSKEFESFDKVNSYFLLDPNWQLNLHDISFPKLYERRGKQWIQVEEENSSGLIKILQSADAIISKPGGGTLADSFMTYTPIIFLEPLSDYEKENAKMWVDNGFGIGIQEWLETDKKEERLKQLRENIIEASRGVKIIGEEIYERTTNYRKTFR